MTKVVPSIIPKNFDDLKDKIDLVADFVESVQVDVSDGEFAESITWPYSEGEEGPNHILPYKDSLNIEIDLFAVNSEEVAGAWIKAGAKAIVLHLETLEDPSPLIADLKLKDVSVGLSINPSSRNELLDEWLASVDFVQFMGNDKVGFSGVELDENVYDKIKEFRKGHPEIEVAVDIGVNFETASKLVEAGATKLISGTTIFGNKDIGEAIEKLKNS